MTEEEKKRMLEEVRKSFQEKRYKLNEYIARMKWPESCDPQKKPYVQYWNKVYREGTYAEQIDNIMKNFDFVKVHQVMGFLNWPWPRTDGEKVTGSAPTLETIKNRATELLIAAAGKPGGRIMQGGFSAMNIHGTLTLTFELETYTGE